MSPADRRARRADRRAPSAAVRTVSTILANVLLWAGTPFYDVYEEAHRPWGLSASADQGIAGGIMLVEGSLVTIGALA